jgi:hypothetical protein
MDWALVLLNAKNFLIKRNAVGSVALLTGYYEFVRRVFFHIRDVGYANAAPLIQADIVQWKSWGFSERVLQSLALLQGVVIKV